MEQPTNSLMLPGIDNYLDGIMKLLDNGSISEAEIKLMNMRLKVIDTKLRGFNILYQYALLVGKKPSIPLLDSQLEIIEAKDERTQTKTIKNP